MFSSSTLCENCKQQPKYFDSATGFTHPYCNKTCARQAKRQLTSPSSTSSTSSDNCENCKARPKYQDPASGVTHPYCGKRCATSHAKSSSPTSSTSSNDCVNCKSRPRYRDPTSGVIHPYCGKRCATSNVKSSSTTSSTSFNDCIHCKARPKYRDLASGVTHPYCGKRCAASHARSSSATLSTSSNNCENCQARPKYRDPVSGFTHRYCGKRCAASHTRPQPKTQTVTSTANWTCQAPECGKAPFQNPDGSFSYYCGLSHKALGQTICLMCREAPKQPKSHFCSETCKDDADSNGPMILEVTKGHVTYKSIEGQFKTSWRHTGKPCPNVRFIYKIIVQRASLASYNSYRAEVEARGQFEAAGLSAGNEHRRWHGTRRECNIGDKGHTTLCTSPDCPMCSIIQTSFDLSMFGSKTGWGRFGRGIYTSSTSSKADDYASTDSSSKLTAILLNKVVVGKGYKMLSDDTSLAAPPSGFDSVLAEKGGSLNHDELVVYRDDAIRPSYLVLYEQ